MAGVDSLVDKYCLRREALLWQIDDKHIEKIARFYCAKWKSLIPHLKMNAIKAKDIDRQYTEEEEKRRELLFKWREMYGHNATYEVLIEALLEIECLHDAEGICKLVQDSQTTILQEVQSAKEQQTIAVNTLRHASHVPRYKNAILLEKETPRCSSPKLVKQNIMEPETRPRSSTCAVDTMLKDRPQQQSGSGKGKTSTELQLGKGDTLPRSSNKPKNDSKMNSLQHVTLQQFFASRQRNGSKSPRLTASGGSQESEIQGIYI